MTLQAQWDVVVAGAGNAALCAALSARETGASVLVLERAPRAERGGNSAFTAGAMRVPLRSSSELLQLVPQLADTLAGVQFTPYLEEQMIEDIQRLSGGLSDPELLSTVAHNGFATLAWMAGHGVGFVSHLDRRGVTMNGVIYNPRDASIRADGNGKGLVNALWTAAENAGVEFAYQVTATDLILVDGAVQGLRVMRDGRPDEIRARSVVLATGGFEANPQMRAQHLGPNWDTAKVRGSRFNTGLGLKMALNAGAMAYGNWSGAHAIAQDINAPAFGEDAALGELMGKDSYYLSIIVNRDGKRFVDEGADFRAFTYSTQGHEILRQPGGVAFEIFDAKTNPLLDQSYRIAEATVVSADNIADLARQLGLDPVAVCETVDRFNASVHEHIPLNHAIRDGRGTSGLTPPKSNWAQKIDTPPYWGYPVTAGITFTYGGVRISTRGEVLNEVLDPIPNLYAAGEMVGGLFYRNYPGSSGLVSGAVFGRIAGRSSAQHARQASHRRP